MMLQLNPTIPVVTPLGTAEAVGWIDVSNEHDLQWICFVDESRICAIFGTPYVRSRENLTMGRDKIDVDALFRTQRKAGKLKVWDRLIAWLGGQE